MNEQSSNTAVASSGDMASNRSNKRLEDLALAGNNGGDGNPLKSDPELQVLLKRLSGIKKYHRFQGWKAKFLARLEEFLYEAGMTPAQKASNDFDALLNQFVKRANKVQEHIEKGELSDTKKTVKGTLNLNEMCKTLTTVCQELEHWIPFSQREEKKRQFTKFHLGAVLIRQGFHQYITMTACRDALEFIGRELQHIADRQQHDLFHQFSHDVQRFCDVMADLNLYEVMMKCIEFSEEPEDESEDPEPINIVIKTHDGKTLRLELEPSETIQNIKDAIADGCGIAPSKQIMKYHSKELANGKTLEYHGIQDRSTLTVEPVKIPVSIHLWDGRTIQAEIVPTDSIAKIKADLQEESGLAPDNQHLSMNAIPLSDDRESAEFYGIQEGTRLDLKPKSITVNVALPTGGDLVPVEIAAQDTSDEIKSKIELTTGMPAPKQVLKYNGRKIADGVPATDLGLENGSLLQVEVRKVPVTVNTWDGRQLQLSVDPTASIADLKQQLEEAAGLSPDNQQLAMADTVLDDDSAAAEDCGIRAGSELDLEPKTVQVTVQLPDGSQHVIAVAPSRDTCRDLKAKIEDATGLASPRQVLKVRGKELPDDGTKTTATAKDLGIQEGTSIKVEIFRVPVTVRTMDGQQISVMVDPTDKLRDVKAQLEKDSGVAPDNQRLFFDGNELTDDDKKIADYGIRGGSELDLEPKRMEVTVETPDGKTHTIAVAPSDTVADMKDKIEHKTGMSAPRQVLKVGGKVLPDDGASAAKDHGIHDGTTIQVEVFKVPISVNTMDGRQIKMMIDPTDKLSNIKVQLENEAGVNGDNQRLFMNGDELLDDEKIAGDYGIQAGSELDMEPKKMGVTVETPDGKTHTIAVAPSDTADKIKANIETATGMAAPRQVLKLNGKELPAGKLAKDMGIHDGSTIQVEVFRVPVTVNTMDGNQIKVMVDPTEMLGNIKKQLEKKSGVPAGNQNLLMNGKALLDDEKVAKDYGIKAGSELDMEPKTIEISAEMPDGTVHIVNVAPSDTSEKMKANIEAVTGMAAPRQLLKYDGKELTNGKTAKDAGIQDGSTIKVEVYKVPITVNILDGKQIKVKIDPTESLCAIKNQLAKESSIPAGNQMLFRNGKGLKDDNKPAKEHGIKAGSVLDLEPNMIKVSVELPDGSSHAIDIALADMSYQIKEKIEKATGMAVPRQVINFGGKLLPPGKCAKDAGMRDGSTINVGIFTMPITVKTLRDGEEHKLQVEPSQSMESVKKMLQKKTGLAAHKQDLKHGKEEMTDNRKLLSDYGITKGAMLTLEPLIDAIIFVDIKCGTLFALDRDDVIEKEAPTPNQGNKLDFLEAATDSTTRGKILEKMKGSPTLGVAVQVVVQAVGVDDYDMQEAEKVKSMWGVNLKKREKNKAGEEFIFVDSKTGACGELARKKYIDMGFIHPKVTPKGEALEEEETDNMVYDKYVADIRRIFGVRLVN